MGKLNQEFRYHKSLVAYTDVLGFGELIANETPSRISKLLRVFKEQQEAKSLFGKGRMGNRQMRRFVNFSDLCLITSNLEPPNEIPIVSIAIELFSLAMGQETLLRSHGVIVRGGVTIGLARASRGLLYGPGIIEAYKLESKTAQFPRIVVHESVVKELTSPASDEQIDTFRISGKNILAKDSDGQWFIDYLGLVKQLEPTNMNRILASHRRFAEKRWKEKPEHRAKYEWLLQYQDRADATPPGIFDKEQRQNAARTC